MLRRWRCRQPIRSKHFVNSPGTKSWECIYSSFLSGLGQGIGPDAIPPLGFVELTLKTRSFVQSVEDTSALFLDRSRPTGAPPIRLVLPLEQMGQKHRHPASQLSLFALAHVFNLLRDVLQIKQIEPTGTNQPSLLIGPRHYIRLVTCRNSLHDGFISGPATTSL